MHHFGAFLALLDLKSFQKTILIRKRRIVMRYLTIRYKNNLEDIVPAPLLDQLIATDSIKQFCRPSEQRWIMLGIDKTRGMGGAYEGLERRWFNINVTKIRVTSQA
jgi:hypothetical protein